MSTEVESLNFLRENWGEEIANKISYYAVNEGKEMAMDDFLSHCTACGGNWGGMLLTGIKELFSNVWDAIPDDMGVFAWACLCETLKLCGVTSSEG